MIHGKLPYRMEYSWRLQISSACNNQALVPHVTSRLEVQGFCSECNLSHFSIWRLPIWNLITIHLHMEKLTTTKLLQKMSLPIEHQGLASKNNIWLNIGSIVATSVNNWCGNGLGRGLSCNRIKLLIVNITLPWNVVISHPIIKYN